MVTDWAGPINEDVVKAAVNLIGRTGAKELQFGFLDDDVPVRSARWWAHARYRGARIVVEEQPGPDAALEALAERVLTGGQCQHCGGLVALRPDGAFAFGKAHLADGRTWTAEQAARTKQCLWRREGPRWLRGCETPAGPSRRERRAKRRRK